MKSSGLLLVGLGMLWSSMSRMAMGQNHFPPLEFLQNKGQWAGNILYKGDISAGHVFLRRSGFTYMLLSPAGMARVAHYYHGQIPVGDSDDLRRKAFSSAGQEMTDLPPRPKVPLLVRGDTYEMNFLQANTASQIVPDHLFPDYFNYFIGNDSTKWAGHVASYGAVTYKDLYPQTDVRVYSEASQLKYDLILYPGADPRRIRLQYLGQQGLEIHRGQLRILTGVGDVTELSPFAYQIIGGSKVLVPCAYMLKGNTVSFRVKSYDHSHTLIIDPLVVFATFTGSRGDNWGYTATFDSQGNFYAGGIIFGQSGNYITTPGAFQQNFGGGTGIEGGFDMAICKFNSTGNNLIYATYIGGANNEQPHSLVVDPQGDLVIAGRTDSKDYPALVKIGPLGGWDIVITKLNPSGSGLIGSMQIGGSDDDGVNISDNRELGTTSLLRNYGDDARSEVELDNAGNIYLASCTQSLDFPVTSGVFQPVKGDSSTTYGNGLVMQDGVVLKLYPDLSGVIWASFLGGNANDAAYVVELDHAGNLYVAGGTASTDLKTTPGVIQPAFGGGPCDGYIAEISNDGTTLERMTYLGTSSADQIYGLQFDNAGFVYVTGVTEGNWPVVNAAFSNPGSKQFIAKLNPDLSGPFVYSTVFGVAEATPNISPVAFLVDKCQNVYVSGWGGELNTRLGYTVGSSGTTGMPITADAVQSTTDGSDFYFFVLKKNAVSQLYGTYYGGNGLLEHVDGGTSRFDKNGIIYEAICGGCGGSSNFPTTPGAWSQVNNSQNCNEVALKMAFNLSGVRAGIRTLDRDTGGCSPLNVQFVDTIGNGKSFYWDYGDGSPGFTSTTPESAPHIYGSAGMYRARLIAVDSSSCNVADTSYMNIQVRSDRATLAFVALKLPPCENLSYQFTNTSTAPPGKPFGNSFMWDFGDGGPFIADDTTRITHGYSAPGNYQVEMILQDTSYCNSPDSVLQTIRLSPEVQAVISTPSSGCVPYNAVLVNNSLGGLDFNWDFGDGSPQSTEVSPTHLYNKPGIYTVTLIANDSTSCNRTDTTRDTITVNAPPVAGFDFSPGSAQANTATQFLNTSSGALTYLWNFGDGSSDTLDNPSHVFPKTGNFKVCLDAFNTAGCPDSICKAVNAIIIPRFDIPNAFSPNGDGINDVFRIQGFGIAHMDMRIFNRWGQLIFESKDVNEGWDGRYKGVLQPVDVYAYAISVAFTDGTTTTRTGSITLLR